METNMLIGILIGACVVTIIGYLAYVVKRAFDENDRRISDEVSGIYNQLGELESMSLKDIAEVHRTINDLNNETDRKIENLYSALDSRFDKQESRLKKEWIQENP
jgi:hypothetical protein